MFKIAKDFQAIHPDSAMQTWTPELEEKVLNLAPIKRKLQVSTDGLGQGNALFSLLTCIRSLFIHCTATELTGIFSDIMRRVLRLSGTSTTKTRSGGYLGHGGEGIGGKEFWL